MRTPPWFSGLREARFSPQSRSWAGLGSLLTGLVLLVAAEFAPGLSGGGSGPLWWVLWGLLLLLGLTWLPLARASAGEREEARLPLLVAALVLVLCSVLVFQNYPSAYFGGEPGADAEGAAEAGADYASVLRLLGLVAVALGAATTMFAGVPERLRSGRETLVAALGPLLVFVLIAGYLATEGPRDSVSHRTAHAPEAAAVPGSDNLYGHGGVAWLWEHPQPGSREAFHSAVTPTGFLVMDRRGVFALDPATGKEVWRFRSADPVMRAAATPDGESVVVLRPLRRLDGSLRDRLSLLDSATGQVIADYDFDEPGNRPEEDSGSSYSRGRDPLNGAPHLTDSSVLSVPREKSEAPLVAYDLTTGEELWTREPEDGCLAGTGRQAVTTATTGIMVVEACGSDREDHVTFLDEATGESRGELELPSGVGHLAVAPDGSVAVISHQSQDRGSPGPDAVAVDPADGTVFAEGLPGDHTWSGGLNQRETLSTVTPAAGGHLLWTEIDERGGLAYRDAPATGGTGVPLKAGRGARGNAVGPVTVSEALVVGSVSGGNKRGRWDTTVNPEVILMGRKGQGPVRVAIEDEVSTYANGSATGIEAHIAPGGVVITGFGTGRQDHAHVIGLGSTPEDL
ncbi:outer membrane protein assembly factor BamB family protein [Nocardiopsis ganjiahuensis]|uniref:outer membrane protein assembly factor BamB family protein n=1 Tax=Nocardiopsis ganjiahuensis TaxID=239984 RepID=UPI0003497116|nr:PQQ-binding-like beta-propeller repeat protein [Nocardiopsis ganjiahuensis]